MTVHEPGGDVSTDGPGFTVRRSFYDPSPFVPSPLVSIIGQYLDLREARAAAIAAIHREYRSSNVYELDLYYGVPVRHYGILTPTSGEDEAFHYGEGWFVKEIEETVPGSDRRSGAPSIKRSWGPSPKGFLRRRRLPRLGGLFLRGLEWRQAFPPGRYSGQEHVELAVERAGLECIDHPNTRRYGYLAFIIGKDLDKNSRRHVSPPRLTAQVWEYSDRGYSLTVADVSPTTENVEEATPLSSIVHAVIDVAGES